MWQKNRRGIYGPIRPLFFGMAILPLIVASGRAAEPLSWEAVRARLQEQSEAIDSLGLRVRRTTTLHVDSEVLQTWPSQPNLPKHLGMDEILIAFKGDRRYLRVLELDYHPQAVLGSSSQTRKGKRRYLDEAAVWTGSVLRERKRNLQTGQYEYCVSPPARTRVCFPPTYLTPFGLMVANPVAGDQPLPRRGQANFLAACLDHVVVLEKTEEIGGRPCAVLEGEGDWSLSDRDATPRKNATNRIWLDMERGLALCQWEKRIDGQLIRVVNSDFAELLPGLWFPAQSRTEIFPPADAPKQYHDQPMVTEEARIHLRVVNQVPDDFFDSTLTKPRWGRQFGGEFRPLPPAYHSRRTRFDRSDSRGGYVEEVWEQRHVGRRVEVRRGSETERLIVDTPRWHFVWAPARNRVSVSPSRLATPQQCPWPRWLRPDIMCNAEVLLGVPACRKDRLGGKEVDKVTFYYPADPEARGLWPIHSFEPEFQRVKPPGNRTRTFWFDPKTQHIVHRMCGCKSPKHEISLDYPPPESMSRDLFSFQIPPTAHLEVADPELGRPLESEGQTKGD